MQTLNLSTARANVLADIHNYVAEVQRISASPFNRVEEGMRVLVALRRTSYEDLNQIQHEYAAVRAVEWLSSQPSTSRDVTWQWNPRQTGDRAEPDIRASLEGVTVLSGEVTTSPEPKGLIDTRMAFTLRKLAAMEGQRYYFVLTEKMARRARTKAIKAGYDITVVQLEDDALRAAL